LEIKIGCVAICHKQRVAVVTRRTTRRVANGKGGVTWHGIGFDGKPWQSQDPAWIADNVEEVLANLKKYKGLR
jgi:hypothetical protein